MKFRTEIDIKRPPFSLSASDSVLLTGSCFSDNIGSRMLFCGLNAQINPCGVQYNPASIAQLFHLAMRDDLPDDYFFRYADLQRCWLMPSAYAASDDMQAHNRAFEALKNLHEALLHADVLILTFGTAQVYKHLKSETSAFEGIVSNCHKVPQREFLHTMLSAENIVEEWRELTAALRKENPNLKIIYTVSPVRHLNPSPRLNTLSKATLHLAVDALVEDDEASYYFPAWEIVMDELRDYRFYAADMTHPSEQAADYIWELFRNTFYDSENNRKLDEAAAHSRRMAHRRLTY